MPMWAVRIAALDAIRAPVDCQLQHTYTYATSTPDLNLVDHLPTASIIFFDLSGSVLERTSHRIDLDALFLEFVLDGIE